MKFRVPVKILVAGAAVTVGVAACSTANRVQNPPAPDQGELAPEPGEPASEDNAPPGKDAPPATAVSSSLGPTAAEAVANPPPPTELEGLPSWEEVASGHPEGATNPPSPFLRVTPEGECFKFFRGMMMPPRPGEIIGDRVEPCPEEGSCGTQIACPEPRASELLEAYRTGEVVPSKPIPPKPSGEL
jgi:hypothetical protein